jgi:polar amino acid transport system substrate-binding protein
MQGVPASAATVPLVTGSNFPPFADQGTPQGGTAVKVVQAVFARMGDTVTLDWLPWKRGYSLTLSGRYRATFPYVRSADREREFIFSEPIIAADSFLYFRDGDDLAIARPTGFRGRVVCVALGYVSLLETSLQAMIERGEIRVERVSDVATCARMLAHKRVDAFSAPEALAHEVLRDTGTERQIQRSAKPIASMVLMLIAPKDNPDSVLLIQRFNTALRQFKADGGYKRLLQE